MTGRVAWVAASIALLLAAIAGMPSRCGAAGIGLRWGSCEGASNRNFACDPNTGSEVLVVSFSPATEIDALTGVAALGRIAAADGSVPPWWQMVNRGSCRYSSLSTSFVLDDQVECEDPWQRQGMGGIAAYRLEPQGAAFLVGVAVAPQYAQPARTGQSYAALKLIINHQRSSGPGSCEGCSIPMCITIESVSLGQPNLDPTRQQADIVLTLGRGGLGGVGNVVTWQGGTPRCGEGGAKPATWAQIKKRYH